MKLINALRVKRERSETLCTRWLYFVGGSNVRRSDNTLAYNAGRAAGIKWAERATAELCTEMAVNRQGTVSQFPTIEECVAFNEGCRDVATAIKEKFGLGKNSG